MTDMARESDPLLLALHPIRLKGTAEADVVADLSGRDRAEVETALAKAAAEDLVTYREGRFGGYRLTPQGRERHAELLAEDAAHPVRRAGIELAYEGFLPLNAPLKEICHAWQIRDGEPNDHTDADYDATVVARLAELDARAQDVLARAGERSARMGVYGTRLARALGRVQGGDLAAFAKPMAGSYHDAWMELHQDLLLSLGRERSEQDGH